MPEMVMQEPAMRRTLLHTFVQQCSKSSRYKSTAKNSLGVIMSAGSGTTLYMYGWVLVLHPVMTCLHCP